MSDETRKKVVEIITGVWDRDTQIDEATDEIIEILSEDHDGMRAAALAPEPIGEALTPPRLGQPWQGGIYAGIVLGEDGESHYLVVNVDEDIEDATWPAATAWAAALRTGGFDDWRLPNRREGHVAKANAGDRFERAWYWLGTQCAGYESLAWAQYFGGGGQFDCDKVSEFRARAVRSLTIR